MTNTTMGPDDPGLNTDQYLGFAKDYALMFAQVTNRLDNIGSHMEEVNQRLQAIEEALHI